MDILIIVKYLLSFSGMRLLTSFAAYRANGTAAICASTKIVLPGPRL